jgi:hypothetical protein
MTTFYGRQTTPASLLHRKPGRVTITIPWALRQSLQERADEEGRSLSNLLAHLLEVSMNDRPSE